MSFPRRTTIGSMPLANSAATASRTMRSPSFSRRLISTSSGASPAPVRTVAVLLAEVELAGQLGALGEVGEQVAQQQARPLDVAPRLLDEVEELGIHAA